uniref:Uncharacterized protein n=1 Tax=Cyanistes caeruleus TaxID=156563 RepID=A0A8C0U9Z4_CYACU
MVRRGKRREAELNSSGLNNTRNAENKIIQLLHGLSYACAPNTSLNFKLLSMDRISPLWIGYTRQGEQ